MSSQLSSAEAETAAVSAQKNKILNEVQALQLDVANYNESSTTNFTSQIDTQEIISLKNEIERQIQTKVTDKNSERQKFLDLVTNLTTMKTTIDTLTNDKTSVDTPNSQFDIVNGLKTSIDGILLQKKRLYDATLDIENLKTRVDTFDDTTAPNHFNPPFLDANGVVKQLQDSIISNILSRFDFWKQNVQILRTVRGSSMLEENVRCVLYKSWQTLSWNRMCQYMYFQVLFYCAKSLVLNDRATKIKNFLQNKATSGTTSDAASVVPSTSILGNIGRALGLTGSATIPEAKQEAPGDTNDVQPQQLTQVYEELAYNTLSMKSLIETFMLFKPVMDQVLTNPLCKKILENMQDEISEVALTNFQSSFEVVQNKTILQSFTMQYKPELVDLIGNLFTNKVNLSIDGVLSNLSVYINDKPFQQVTVNTYTWDEIKIQPPVTDSLVQLVYAYANLELYKQHCENIKCDEAVVLDLVTRKMEAEVALAGKTITDQQVIQVWTILNSSYTEDHYTKIVLIKSFENYIVHKNIINIQDTLIDITRELERLKGSLSRTTERKERNEKLLSKCKGIKDAFKDLNKSGIEGFITSRVNISITEKVLSSIEEYSGFLHQYYYYLIHRALAPWMIKEINETKNILSTL